jgi:two-component system, cell cycle response regulator DivK
MNGAGKPRVLVVDDHPLNLKLLQRVLELDGFDVIAAECLSAAQDEVARALPDLIVLDLQLPDGDGLSLARELKGRPTPVPVSILACTAGAMKGERERALDAGCDAYMSKPIDTRDFAELCVALLPARFSSPRMLPADVTPEVTPADVGAPVPGVATPRAPLVPDAPDGAFRAATAPAASP